MTDRKIVTQLIKFGFTVPQAKLYLAGLKLGPELMARLSRQSSVRRTTAYYIMKELMRRGFFSMRKVGKRSYYIATNGKELFKMIRRREKLIKKLLPLLNKLK
ncbi:MAG: hypothetical protein A3H72_00320 [Candidatus Doudnabacteria bacterium RIFCSPLOWO2_02_FULL_48_8]|uniref:Transcription regulator TrmB N-terminal domain-containing protein n=1 Tax=Candidatus Doudnabacteria bacterium RIFCSPHIGHO2_01_FULL_46_24 TaxID=1817825 RepID=A0A1F5NX39_9BACT|nr:MAG: hypothetical protein A2720_03600 [Candidatus Doudnabacteria bacterium RIFCSPHIGHO2_01_FULL_46_24]OGE95310.1 MAG: hypothetical protein A3H72_00320 [Candidatus Doudnabacteria bacterium RIFCSPLOWO2_02_FULL_48_8]OGE95614.1 MAG: hypothetical protein A3E98_01285 [Candidatus Doudnabacteria bacterium RIFCSPHIGHO2_12_FULL_48_11]